MLNRAVAVPWIVWVSNYQTKYSMSFLYYFIKLDGQAFNIHDRIRYFGTGQGITKLFLELLLWGKDRMG